MLLLVFVCMIVQTPQKTKNKKQKKTEVVQVYIFFLHAFTVRLDK